MPTFAPQPGAQTAFLASPADLVVYGGAAGGGKSYALLLDELRHVHRPGYRSVIFRRTSPQITAGGGLWDTAGAIFPRFGGVANQSALKYTFPSGAEVKFTHLEHEKTKYNHDGSQYAKESFDELIHFTRTQFFYLLSRLRSVCGVRPYVRATTNPDAASWVRQFIAWWIDPDTGLPVPDRAGALRWFYRANDELFWFDSRADAEAAHPDLAADVAHRHRVLTLPHRDAGVSVDPWAQADPGLERFGRQRPQESLFDGEVVAEVDAHVVDDHGGDVEVMGAQDPGQVAQHVRVDVLGEVGDLVEERVVAARRLRAALDHVPGDDRAREPIPVGACPGVPPGRGTDHEGCVGDPAGHGCANACDLAVIRFDAASDLQPGRDVLHGQWADLELGGHLGLDRDLHRISSRCGSGGVRFGFLVTTSG